MRLDNLVAMFHIERRQSLSPSQRSRIVALIDVVTTANGHRPISDQLWSDLRATAASDVVHLVAQPAVAQAGAGPHTASDAPDPTEIAGYAQAAPSNGAWAIGVVVSPVRPDRDRLIDSLVAAALALVSDSGGGPVQWWVLGDDDVADSIAARQGFDAVRTLLQMRVDLPVDAGVANDARPVAVRPFRPGRDEAAWLQVNNAAFGWHAEQGGWDLATLVQREREAWFDAEGFLLHERNGRLAGFCWTKVHPTAAPPLGEIYVIAVHPDFHGLGLGRALTTAGLVHMFERGITTGMLYVDETNVAAVGLYRSMGFRVHQRDRAHLVTVPQPARLRTGEPQ